MSHAAYPTDLSDAQWALLEPLMPDQKPLGRDREVDLREVVNAIFYVNRAGCQWDMLPHDFPKSKTELQSDDDALEFARKNRTVRYGAVAQISPRGTELPQESSGNLQVVDLGDSLSDSHCGVSDPQLVRLVEVWPGLSGDTRDVIPCSRGL